MITELSTPPAYSSAHDRAIFLVSSNNSTYDNFKFVFDIYVDSTKVATIKRWCIPGTSIGVLDVADIVRAYLSNIYFFPNVNVITNITSNGFFRKSFYIKYGEEMGTPPTAYLNMLTSATFWLYNYANDIDKYPNYVQLSMYDGNWLTNNPKVISIDRSDKYYLSYFKTVGGSRTFSIKTYNEAGVLQSTHTQISANDLIQLGVGCYQINNLWPGTINDTISYYTIDDGVGNVVRFNIDAPCRYKQKHLVFLNRLGGYESAYFRGKSMRSMEIEKKTFGKNNYRVFGFDQYSAGYSLLETTGVPVSERQPSSVMKKYKQRLSTDFLTDAEFTWLGELIASPAVYMEMSSSGFFVPVNITNSNYEFKTRSMDGINPIEIEVEFLNTFTSQLV